MKNITSMDNPPESRRQGGVGDDDIQIITRTYGYADGKNQEETTTGESARNPVFDKDKMQSYYDLQTAEMNGLREDMNNIKPGSGDKAFGDRMAKRLHLDMADGHNPGGIPNDKAETIMGVYDYKDLKVDVDGNMYQKKGKKFYKLNNYSKREVGLIAEEVNEVYPEFVSEDASSINYGKMVTVLVEAVKELNDNLNQAKERIKILENPE